jgi:hypothetical protein
MTKHARQLGIETETVDITPTLEALEPIKRETM